MTFSRLIVRHCRRLVKSVNYPIKRNFSSTIALKMSFNMKEFTLENNTPFEQLEVSEAFENLTEKERKYLHYYTKVSELLMRC